MAWRSEYIGNGASADVIVCRGHHAVITVETDECGEYLCAGIYAGDPEETGAVADTGPLAYETFDASSWNHAAAWAEANLAAHGDA